MRALKLNDNIIIYHTKWLSESHAYACIAKGKTTMAWAVVDKYNMTIDITPQFGMSYGDTSWYMEKLLRFTAIWLRHDIRMNPKDLTLKLSTANPEMLSAKYFKNTVFFT